MQPSARIAVVELEKKRQREKKSTKEVKKELVCQRLCNRSQDVPFLLRLVLMQERWSTPTFKRRVGKPTRVLPLVDHSIVTEHKLNTGSFAVATAFNDTSLHWFSKERLSSVPEMFRA